MCHTNLCYLPKCESSQMIWGCVSKCEWAGGMFGLGLSKIRTSEKVLSLKTHPSSLSWTGRAAVIFMVFFLKPFKRQTHQPGLFQMWTSVKKKSYIHGSTPMHCNAVLFPLVWNDCLLSFSFEAKMIYVKRLWSILSSIVVRSLCMFMNWN